MKLLLLLLAVTAGALLVAEIVLRPLGQDRAVLLAVYSATALAAFAAAWSATRLTRRSLRAGVLAVAVVGVAVVALAVGAATVAMALSPHDLRLVAVSLTFGVAAGLVVAHTLGQRLAQDLGAIVATARRFADGDRGARTEIDRPDEVGEVAYALDALADRVEAAEADRDRSDAARRAFLTAVSHDLRSPLTSLRGAVEALQDGVAADPGRYLEAMQREVSLLGTLVDDLFLLAVIESGALELAPERVDLAELADEAIEAIRPVAARRDVTVRLAADAAVLVHASPRELRRVLRNLLDNASRHAPQGGRVEVEVAAQPQPTVTVLDDGPGFPPDFTARAFDSFSRADAARLRDGAGAGLGLAIARGLVVAQGGRIEARPGPGGQVRMSLPAPP